MRHMFRIVKYSCRAYLWLRISLVEVIVVVIRHISSHSAYNKLVRGRYKINQRPTELKHVPANSFLLSFFQGIYPYQASRRLNKGGEASGLSQAVTDTERKPSYK